MVFGVKIGLFLGKGMVVGIGVVKLKLFCVLGKVVLVLLLNWSIVVIGLLDFVVFKCEKCIVIDSIVE